MNRLLRLSLLLTLSLLTLTTASAQQRRSPRQLVRGGIVQRPDTLPRSGGADSLLTAQLLDSLKAIAADSLAPDSLIRQARTELEELAARRNADSLTADPLDTLIAGTVLDSLARLDSLPLPGQEDSTVVRRRKGWLMSDSMSLSKVCWLSTVLPGYGQVYNKQYWKLPILYGTVGAGIGMFVYENNKYKPLKQRYEAITSLSRERTPELDALQASMIRHNTRRQAYLFASIASYLYFIGDAAVNYRTNDVSRVKKATTLACICPGAGQIYNRSYWKVPFVVGGFAAMVYCIDWNNRGYQRFKKAYGLVADYDNHPENYPDGPTDEFSGRYSASYLRDLRNNFRRNRDLCIILTGALYVIQIIDAHVDAHLKDYDISDDLSMNLEPLVDYTFVPAQGSNRPVFGFNLSLTF